MTESKNERLYFEPLKEVRDAYFVEYQPPVSDNRFATLSLVYPSGFELPRVADDMRSEMNHWLARYPVPLMVSAFDAAENIIRPHGIDDDAFLVGWHTPDTSIVASSWKLDELPEFLKLNPNADWRLTYADISYRTQTQVTEHAKMEAKKTKKQIRFLTFILVLWLAVIPAVWEAVKYFGHEWLSLAVFAYVMFKAWVTWNKLLGHLKTTRSEEEKAEKQRKMDHYFYHCERNPEGFSRLMVENLERDIRERTKKEAESLDVKKRVDG